MWRTRCSLRDNGDELDGMVVEILRRVPLRGHPLDMTSFAALIAHCPILERRADVGVGQPDHDTRRDIVHRDPFVRAQTHAKHLHAAIVEFGLTLWAGDASTVDLVH
jgi:hypothetical protein